MVLCYGVSKIAFALILHKQSPLIKISCLLLHSASLRGIKNSIRIDSSQTISQGADQCLSKSGLFASLRSRPPSIFSRISYLLLHGDICHRELTTAFALMFHTTSQGRDQRYQGRSSARVYSKSKPSDDDDELSICSPL